MCLGAIPWSGVRSLSYAAQPRPTPASVGFDEGDKPANWQQTLLSRGIAVAENILQPEAAQILKDYTKTNGKIYNPSRRD